MEDERLVLKSARFVAHDAAARFIRPGDTVVDATMGNGHDTLMLCGLVGESGRVYAFDVQPDALRRTDELLSSQGVRERAELILDGHEHMDRHITFPVDMIMFNLGWLPGSPKGVTTMCATTMAAVTQALRLLRCGGLCSVCVYPGHAEGDAERAMLTEYFTSLRPQEFNVLHHRFPNAGSGAPECFLIQKQPQLTASQKGTVSP